jgi:hypothetical protein
VTDPHLFVCGLFNDAVSSSDYITSGALTDVRNNEAFRMNVEINSAVIEILCDVLTTLNNGYDSNVLLVVDRNFLKRSLFVHMTKTAKLTLESTEFCHL